MPESFSERGKNEKIPEWAGALKEHLEQLKNLSRKKLKEKLGSLNLQGIESLEKVYKEGGIDELEYLKSVRDFLDDAAYWERIMVDDEGRRLVEEIFQDKIEEEKQRKEQILLK